MISNEKTHRFPAEVRKVSFGAVVTCAAMALCALLALGTGCAAPASSGSASSASSSASASAAASSSASSSAASGSGSSSSVSSETAGEITVKVSMAEDVTIPEAVDSPLQFSEEEVSVVAPQGATALTVLQGTGREIQTEGAAGQEQVVAIGSLANGAAGEGSHWTYAVNGVTQTVSPAQCPLQEDDELSWLFVR